MAKTEKQKDDGFGFKIEYHATPRTRIVKVSIRTLNFALLAGTAGVIGNEIIKWFLVLLAANN